jgi:hypothetical protein
MLTTTDTYHNSDHQPAIGNNHWAPGDHQWAPLNGVLDEARIYDRALCAEEIQYLYNHPGNRPPDSFSLLFPPNKAFTPRKVRFDWETAPDSIPPCDQVRYDLYVSTSYHHFLDSATVYSNLVTSEYMKTLNYGAYYWKVKAKDNYRGETWSNQIGYFMVTGIHYSGDVNGDGFIDAGDVVFLINYLYSSGPAPDPLEAGDATCDGVVDVSDVVYLLNYLFVRGPAPGC